MPVNQINPPFPTFNDQDGYPLNGGYLYIGQPGFEAQSTPKASFFDVGMTIPTGSASGAAIRINGGYAVYNGAPSLIYAEVPCSLTVKDQNDVLIFSSLNYDPSAGFVGTITEVNLFSDLVALTAVQVAVGSYVLVKTLKTWYKRVSSGGHLGHTAATIFWEVQAGDRGFDARAFGAVGNGVADDSPSLQAAITAAPALLGAVHGASATYRLATPITMSGKVDLQISDLKVIGNATRFAGYFNVSGSDGVFFDNVTFDHMFGVVTQFLPADYASGSFNVGIYGTTCGDVTVRNCRFDRLYTRSINLTGAGKLTVRGCAFTSPVQNQTQILDYISLLTSRALEVVGNTFLSAATTKDFGTCAVVYSGITEGVLIADNETNWCGRDNTGSHRLGVFDGYFDAKNVRVSGNVSRNCLAQFARCSAVTNLELSGNIIDVAPLAETGYSLISLEGYYFGAVGTGIKRAKVVGNIINDPSNRQAVSIQCVSYDWGYSSDDVTISGNTFNGGNNIVNIVGPYSGMRVENNIARNGGTIIRVNSDTGAPALTATFGTEANARMKGLVIAGNDIESVGTGDAIFVGTTKTPTFTGQMADAAVTGNRLVNTAGTGNTGITLDLLQNTITANVRVGENWIEGFTAAAVYARNASRLIIENNRGKNNTVGFLDGTNTVISRRENAYHGGALEGQATLVAGAALVPTTEIRAGDLVELTPATAGGTRGHLHFDTIVSGTSFAARSSSGADTSTILWRIRK